MQIITYLNRTEQTSVSQICQAMGSKHIQVLLIQTRYTEQAGRCLGPKKTFKKTHTIYSAAGLVS